MDISTIPEQQSCVLGSLIDLQLPVKGCVDWCTAKSVVIHAIEIPTE